MNNVKITVKIDIEPTETGILSADTPEKSEEGCFQLIVDGKSSLDIDVLEEGLLRTSYPALREALAQYLEQQSETEALKKSKQLGERHQVIRHQCDYRVDGEIGRFEFCLFDVQTSDERIAFEGTSLFPKRRGKQWYQTCGFKELALLGGVAERTYRQTTKGLNRCRRQEVGGTPLNTLRDSAEAEGGLVVDFLERKTEQILKEECFTKKGLPEPDCQAVIQAKNSSPAQLEEKQIKEALASVSSDMQKRGLASDLIEEVNESSLEKTYEKPIDTVNIHLDKVGVKKQKEHRNNQKNETGSVTTNKRPRVQNTATCTVRFCELYFVSYKITHLNT